MTSVPTTKPNQTTVWCEDLEEDDMRQVTVRGSLVRYSVFVCKLGCKITEEDLTQTITDFLTNHGWNSTRITTVKICKTKGGVSKGYGFIELDDDEACAALIDQKVLKIGNREVTVSEAVRKHPEEMVLRKEHVDLVSNSNRRNSMSKSSDDSSERMPSPPYTGGCVPQNATPATNLIMSPIPDPATSPVLMPPPQHHALIQPSTLPLISNQAPMMQQPAMLPSNRLMMPPCTMVSSSTMMTHSGLMAPPTMVSSTMMSPIASLQNVIPQEQNPALPISHPLLYQGVSPSVFQNYPYFVQTPTAPLFSPIYYQQVPQYQCVPNNIPRYPSPETPFCYIASM